MTARYIFFKHSNKYNFPGISTIGKNRVGEVAKLLRNKTLGAEPQQGPRSHGVNFDPPLLQVRGPHTDHLDPSLFVAFTCAQSVGPSHSFIQLLFNSPQIMIVPKDLKLKANNRIHIHYNLLT